MRLVLIKIAVLIATAAPAWCETMSGDGRWIAWLDEGGTVLVIAETISGAPVHKRALISQDQIETRAAAVIAVPARRSFVVALEGVAELWEIALFPDAGPFHDGFVHSWEKGMEETLSSEEGMFARQRIRPDAPITALAPLPGKRYSLAATYVDGRVVEFNLVVKRAVGSIVQDPAASSGNATEE